MQDARKQPVDWVNPLIDSANRRFFFLTTASRPFGMVNLSPDTRVGQSAWQSGYRFGDEHIHWFSHLHAWQLCGVPVMPVIGAPDMSRGSEGYKSRFTHDREIAQAGYHSVYLEDFGIRADLTATDRVGFHRYTADRAGDMWVVFGLGEAIMLPMSDVFAEQRGRRGLSGYVENDRTVRRRKRVKIFFDAVFDQKIEEVRAWRDGVETTFEKAIVGPGVGIAVRFKVEKGEAVQLKVALSYCGAGQARLNRLAEMPHWDFDAVRREARGVWNQWLGRIEVEGGTDQQKTKFYTDLFHALKGRRKVSDVDGKYLDMTGDLPVVRQIPLGPDGKPSYEHHNSDSLWGAPWSLNLLWNLAWPGVVHNFCNMFVDYYRNGGLIPRGPSGGDYTFVMHSPTSTAFLVSAWTQGVRSFDIESAYQGMLKNHGPGGLMSKAGYEHFTCKGGGVEHYLRRGYVPLDLRAKASHCNGGSMTLEYAFHDWALGELASMLGKHGDVVALRRRAMNYRTLWNPRTRFMQPRTIGGDFEADFDPMDSRGWTEANGHHYRWHVPHNVADLIGLFGSREEFVRDLDNQFRAAEATGFVLPHGHHHTGVMDYGNQPCTYLAHLFNYAGAPWLTQKWVRRVMEVAKSDVTPYGGYGGDEDQGMMGSLNGLMAIGLFNVHGGCDAEPFFEVTSPVFDRIAIRLDSRYHPGGTFVIETENNAPENIYVQSASLNGEPLTKPWFPRRLFAEGGTLRLVLGPNPNKEWGSAPGDAPPSMETPEAWR